MEATIQKLKIIRDKLWSLRSWLNASFDVARVQEHYSAELDEEDRLDAMRSWRDPVEPPGTLHHQHHTLVEDDPPSG
jgi:hypothetical protein